MGPPRAVRISRVARPAAGDDGVGGAPPRGEYRENVAGAARGNRLFGIFSTGLFALYLAFLAVAMRAAGGLGADPAAIALFSAVAAALAVWGFLITLGRAPRGAWVAPDRIVIVERSGRSRRLAGAPPVRVEVLQRYPSGFLSPEETRLVRAPVAGARPRTYLVGVGLLEPGSVAPS